MKYLILIAAILLAVGLCGNEIQLNGGKIIPVDLRMVESSSEDLNFCFATRFSDNSIHLTHSRGIHTVSETPCAEVSFDNGKTWQKPPKDFHTLGMNAAENSKGEKIHIGVWQSKPLTVHKFNGGVIGKDGVHRSFSADVEIPYATGAHSHRDLLRTSSGRLIGTAYGKKANAPKDHIFSYYSDDDGRTWHFLSIVAEAEFNDAEGANEATLVELADGTILVIYRVDGWKACRQKRSNDGGKTWSKSELAAPYGASPHATLLENGTLALVTGRPNLYLYLDFTGTGKKYQRYCVWKGGTSSYASVIEVAPNEVMVLYDESRFMSEHACSDFSRIMAATYKIEKNDGKAVTGDPKAAGFDVFYSAFDRKSPMECKFALPLDYKSVKTALTQSYVRTVPERPYPVLYIQSRGDTVKGGEWARFDRNQVPFGVKKAEVEFEFRLLDNDSQKPQFMVSLNLTPEEGKNMNSYAAFAKDYIQYIDPASGKLKNIPFNFEIFKFRTFVMSCDTVANVWTLKEKGSDKILLKLPMGKGAKAQMFSFGDGGRNVFGSVDLGYIGMKYLD